MATVRIGWIQPRPLHPAEALRPSQKSDTQATRAVMRPRPTEENQRKNQNTSSELHSAARHVSGFLQVVPIETASARGFSCSRAIRVRGSPDWALTTCRE